MASPTQLSAQHRGAARHPGRDSFTLHGVFSLDARGQPLRSRARCDWSPCDGLQLQSWHETAPTRCSLGLQEARTSNKETRKAALLSQDWGWDRPAPHSVCHKCSVAPAFPAKPINPSPVLRSSGRNPAKHNGLRGGFGTQTREVSWDEGSHATYTKAEVRCTCRGCNLPPVIYVFSLKARAAGTHRISATRQCESTRSEELERGERQTQEHHETWR